MPSSDLSAIRLRGIRQNTLKNLDLDLPLGKLIVVTGLSGTGKSSLVFETLHAEGQRRYVETFSAYTRQFLDLLDRPKVESISHIPPSIAIEQTNTIKTSRSTVGTMTELCDFFKVWFPRVARLHDPLTGDLIDDDHPDSITEKILERFAGATILLTFLLPLPPKTPLKEILPHLQQQGYRRLLVDGQVTKLEEFTLPARARPQSLEIIQDRITVGPRQRGRLREAVAAALGFGHAEVRVMDATTGALREAYAAGLRTPGGRTFRAPTPALFSFNSPIGACPTCRGFGRIIEIDPQLAIPDRRLSLAEGAIKPWQGEVYGESQKDLLRFCRKKGIPTNVPFEDLAPDEQAYVLDGEQGYGENGKEWPHAWYGLKGFFQWLESKAYKMHVRVFLSRYRSYRTCPDCGGDRLQEEARAWRWGGVTLPELYRLPVRDLLSLLKKHHPQPIENAPESPANLAYQSILTRLGYLEEVGLGYLTLDRTSRTLSGGEVERVNLTSCLGTSLVDTLFVLDEPSVGLHARDIDRLVRILTTLRDQGNTVVVVEHDEAIMRAADQLIELGPRPGKEGGELVFQGTHRALARHKKSLTGDYLYGRRDIPVPANRRAVPVSPASSGKPPRKKKSSPRTTYPWIQLRKINRHNLRDLSLDLPFNRLVVLSGVSGSGKSTLLNNALYQGWRQQQGLLADDPAALEAISFPPEISDVVYVDQSPVSRTPRSNPALFIGIWDAIRNLFAQTEAARARGLTASSFSFNSGDGRCDHCQGLGYERIEMQFLSDVFVPCPVCAGRRFKEETLALKWEDLSVHDVLQLTITEARERFAAYPRIAVPLQALEEVGLGYLQTGQPLNTLSGGEAQRLKLVRYLSAVRSPGDVASPEKHLLLLDEPTTGLHRHDIARLIRVFDALLEAGHGLIVIEHQMDILKVADWIVELGPEAGADGGEVVAQGTPETVARGKTHTAPFLREALAGTKLPKGKVAEASAPAPRRAGLQVTGAREHNLRNLSLTIPYRELSVITGVSGSGKSTLAFDIIFGEGQRRFMESMSAYARQFVEQMPKPAVDAIQGIPPTVAIEQRVSRGGRKSTVATITEVAQYLRLLYARLGVQHSPVTGEPVISLTPDALLTRFRETVQNLPASTPGRLSLCAPLVRGRKGHHQPIADWLAKHHYPTMRVDGRLLGVADFRRLERYREHDVEAVVMTLSRQARDLPAREGSWSRDETTTLGRYTVAGDIAPRFREALNMGKGSCFLLDGKDRIIAWFSTARTDPATGESFPELDPKHFSFNSPRGWCPTCRGYGRVFDWMKEEEEAPSEVHEADHGETCPSCAGERLNPVSRQVRLKTRRHDSVSLPELLRLNAAGCLRLLKDLVLDERGKIITQDLFPQIEERLRFLNEVGLEYLTLDRGADTLSGGEAQRIRLAAQLGSNLSGVLYVLDEPSIGLHARDNDRLIASLKALRDRGNTLLVVEHDEDTMRAADRVIDLGPGAGVHGGEILACAPLKDLLQHPRSLTGQYLAQGMSHPLRGSFRPLPDQPGRGRSFASVPWMILRAPRLRNLQGDDLFVPLGRLTMVCGVSGAGKSTLFREVLHRAVAEAIQRKSPRLKGTSLQGKNAPIGWPTDRASPLPFAELINGHSFGKVIEVDQSPIGKTPRSTPATYLGAFDLIRQYFAQIPEARLRGFNAGTFSFNTKGGRCETCAGAGRIKMEMNFLPDTYVDCEDCKGTRYGPELRELRWKGKSIAEILDLTFAEAAEFFSFHARLQEMCQLMVDTGLGYLSLGQSSPTLSGGEAQRLKLVAELSRGLQSFRERSRGLRTSNLYILEEPTIGLHFSDCEKLIHVLHQLVDQGHTVIVIEHHTDLLAEADYLVEIGPGGGEHGGRILYQGDLPTFAKKRLPQSPTQPYLKKLIPKVIKG